MFSAMSSTSWAQRTFPGTAKLLAADRKSNEGGAACVPKLSNSVGFILKLHSIANRFQWRSRETQTTVTV